MAGIQEKPASIAAKLQNVVKRIEGAIPAPALKAIDDLVKKINEGIDDLKAQVSARELPPTIPDPGAGDTLMTQAFNALEKAKAEQQAAEQAYQTLYNRNKDIGAKLKDLETRAGTLQAKVREKPDDGLNYFRAKEITKELAEMPALLTTDQLKTQLRQKLTDLTIAQTKLQEAKKQYEELVEEGKQYEAQLADREKGRADTITEKIKAKSAA